MKRPGKTIFMILYIAAILAALITVLQPVAP